MKQNLINKNNHPATPNLHNGHAYVDLDLPSGLLWATCNIGASSPEEYGYYFAWGETEPKQIYYWDTYKFGNRENFSKYTTPGMELEDIDDAAHVNWGGNWRMPTIAELNELCEHCDWTWNGNGYIVKSKTNGNFIFLPSAGYRRNDALYSASSHGFYWLRSLGASKVKYAYLFAFISSYVVWYDYLRCIGHTVRAVCTHATE